MNLYVCICGTLLPPQKDGDDSQILTVMKVLWTKKRRGKCQLDVSLFVWTEYIHIVQKIEKLLGQVHTYVTRLRKCKIPAAPNGISRFCEIAFGAKICLNVKAKTQLRSFWHRHVVVCMYICISTNLSIHTKYIKHLHV